MLVRYCLAEESTAGHEAPVAARVERLQRVEAFSTMTGGLILILMLATLLLAHG
jgi:hypothetical protein